MTTRFSAVAATVIAAVALTTAQSLAGGEDWPQFRGLKRDGISRETGLKKNWPENGPKELWRVPLGEGYSAVSIVGDRLYTMFAADHEGKPTEVAAAFDAATGKQLWRTPVGPKKDTEFGNGPRSTPTVVGGAVYVLGSEGNLAALKAEDGTLMWEVDLTAEFGSQVPHWGFSTSPLVDGDRLIVQAGGAEGKSYVALDRKTGELAWSLGEGRVGYNSPLLVETDGKKRYVYFVGQQLVGVDEDGKQVWSHDWPRGETHAMPVFVAPDRIFASGAEGIGATFLAIDESAEPVAVEELWSNRFMRNHFSSSVTVDGVIYGFDNATLKAISVDDGELLWAKRGLGKGSLIYADGSLYVLSDGGELLLVEASRESFVEKGRVRALEGRTWTAPTLANGRLYLRDQKQMVAFDVSD